MVSISLSLGDPSPVILYKLAILHIWKTTFCGEGSCDFFFSSETTFLYYIQHINSIFFSPEVNPLLENAIAVINLSIISKGAPDCAVINSYYYSAHNGICDCFCSLNFVSNFLLSLFFRILSCIKWYVKQSAYFSTLFHLYALKSLILNLISQKNFYEWYSLYSDHKEILIRHSVW